MSSKVARALDGAIERSRQRNTYRATMGWRTPGGEWRFKVDGRPECVWVTMRLSTGGQTPVAAINTVGIKHAPKLEVEMRKDGDDYIILGKSPKNVKSKPSPSDPSGNEPHLHEHGSLEGLDEDHHPQYHNDSRGDIRYFTKAEHVDSTSGASDAGKPVVLNENGLLNDLVSLTTDDVPEGSNPDRQYITDAEATKLAGIEAGADVTDATNVEAAGAVMTSGNQNVDGEKIFLKKIVQRSVGVGNFARLEAIGDGERALLNTITYKDHASGSLLVFQSARGSEASPLTSLNGDRVGEFIAYGFSQAAGGFLPLAQIKFNVDGTPDSGGDTTDMPGKVSIATTPEGSAQPLDRLTINNAGLVAALYDMTVAGTLGVTGAVNLGAALNMVSGSVFTAETIQAVDATGLVFKNDGGTTVISANDDDSATIASNHNFFPTTSSVIVRQMGSQNKDIEIEPGTVTTAQTWTIDITFAQTNARLYAIHDIKIIAGSSTASHYILYSARLHWIRVTNGAAATIITDTNFANNQVSVTLTGPTAITNGIRYVISGAASNLTRTAINIRSVGAFAPVIVTSVVA